MPRIDRFLTAMKQHGGDSLRLSAGKPVQLARGGILQSITKDQLSAAQVVALLREIAPAAEAEMLGSDARLNFTYQSPIGAIAVTVAPEAGGAGATLRAAGAAGTALRESAPDLAPHRGEIERLLRRMVESGGSDLHLRTDAIPLLRKDGELLRLEEPPITGGALDLLIRSIMTDTEYERFSVEHDHD